MIKAIIFDVDGTLVDSNEIAVKCIQKSAKELNLKIPDRNKIHSFWGRSLKYMVNNLWKNYDHHKFRRYYFNCLEKHKIKQIPGAKAVIKKLKKEYVLGIVSGKARLTMLRQFKYMGIDKNDFKFLLSADDTKFHKPDPKVFAKGVRKLKGINKKEILYVGDFIMDYLAAKIEGFQFVAVLSGFGKRKEFLENGLKNKNILKSIKDLPKWLDKNYV